MDFKGLGAAALAAGLVAIATACGGGETERLPMSLSRAPAASPAAPAAAPADAQRARLEQAPLAEVSFVPADAEAVIRVDLASLAARDRETAHMLDFVLRAQQPAAYETLKAAGIAPGKELRAIYLVVGPRAAAEPGFLVAGVGDIDAARVTKAMKRSGGALEPAADGAVVLVWKQASDRAIGAAIPKEPFSIGAAAVGVTDGLLLLGPPQLVRRALAVRAGQGKDVRRGELARDLVALDATATAWGVARGDGEQAWLAEAIPGLRRMRFYASLAGFAHGELALRAEFATAEQAAAFRGELDELITSATAMARGSSLGETFQRLRDSARFEVEGGIVTVKARM